MVLLLFLLLIILVVHSVFCILKTKEKTKTKDEAVICLLFQLTLVINNGKSNSIMFARKCQNQTVQKSDSSSFFKSKRSLYGLFWHPNVFSFKTHLHSQYIVYKKGLEFGNETVKHWRNHEQTMAYNKSSSFIFKF